jgi:hypothetical protein
MDQSRTGLPLFAAQNGVVNTLLKIGYLLILYDGVQSVLTFVHEVFETQMVTGVHG